MAGYHSAEMATRQAPPAGKHLSLPERAALRLLLAAIDVYAVVTIGYLLLRLLTGDALWPVALASAFAPWLLLPALALAPLLALAHRRRRATALALPAAAFVWLYGALFLPRLSEPAPCADGDPACRNLTVMTYNLGSGMGDPEDLAAVLRSSGADVIALEELVGDHMPALEAVADLYPYQETYTGVIFGKGLISRYPIVDTSGPMQFSTRSTYLFTAIDVEGQPLQVVVAHAPRPLMTRRGYRYEPGTDEDFRALAAYAGGGGQTIMMGDFNTTDQSQNYARLEQAGLSDAYRRAGSGLGLTFPVRRFGPTPVVRIDFVWVSQAFDVLDVQVGPDAGSDHLPVIAHLVWRTDAAAGAAR